MSLYLGAHTVDNGGIDMAVRRAGRAAMKALQIFTAIPKYYGDKTSIRSERVDRFRTALAETEIAPRHVVAHAAYVLNTATPEPEKWTRARDGLAKELERSTRLGIGVVCFHPGAAIDGDTTAAAERVASAIAYALDQVPGDTRVLVENTAGAGRTFARTAAEVAAILAHVPERVRARTGYGLDTCHLWASGYDIRASREALTRVLDEFEGATSEPPGFLHLNDSEGAFASNKDRHVLLGDGTIGAEPFKWLVADRRAQEIPLILETPQQNMEIADDDATADPNDLRMMALLAT
ncbi:MAG TPA: deoxyribonuclease IV [Gemmatimonadaceae bacterium]|nr:deoxyribonuclease IV [Gemmatimonadaceae bacterium]